MVMQMPRQVYDQIMARSSGGPRVTEAEIEAAKTKDGGWTRERLATWGVPWPPPRGWKKRLIKGTK